MIEAGIVDVFRVRWRYEKLLHHYLHYFYTSLSMNLLLVGVMEVVGVFSLFLHERPSKISKQVLVLFSYLLSQL